MAPATSQAKTPRSEEHPPLMTPMSHVKTSPKWSFRCRKDEKNPEIMPAPGHYHTVQPEDTSKFSKGPQHVFGSGDRSNLGGRVGIPGPGQYRHKEHIGESGSKFTCTPRRERPEKDVSTKPGPGAHDIPTSLGAHAPTAKFGSSQRRQGAAPLSPGPAQYEATHNQTAHASPKWGLGTSARQDAGGAKAVPGPGTYFLPSRLVEGPKYSAAPRREETARSEGPGPSAYSLGTSVGTGLQWSMRQRHNQNNAADDPGPGAYQAVTMENVKEQTPGWRFGTSNREPSGSFNPPGPGTYEPSDPRNLQAKCKFGTSHRPSQVNTKQSNPGPGSYEVASEFGQGPKYTVTPRGGTTKLSKTPGPGQYERDDMATTQKAPKYGFGSAKRQGELGAGAGTPGPGTYSHGSTLAGAKFSLQSRRQFESRGGASKVTPGPGAHGGGFTQFGY
jgi:hypothetical protein